MGLNNYLKALRDYGTLKDIKIGRYIILNHLLFVNDILLFGNGFVLDANMDK